MSERTQWDESVDQAIELLISEDTEAFVLTALKSDNEGMHLVQAHQEESDMVLLTIFTLIEEIRKKSVEAGTPLSPEEIMYSAGGRSRRSTATWTVSSRTGARANRAAPLAGGDDRADRELTTAAISGRDTTSAIFVDGSRWRSSWTSPWRRTSSRRRTLPSDRTLVFTNSCA